MDRWENRVAVVTGASSGIGSSIAKALVVKGLKVVGLARRQEKLQELENELKNEKGKYYGKKTDVTKDEEVVQAFQWIKKNLGGADIIVNNAGITINTLIADGDYAKWRQMYDVNVLSLASCTRETINSMKERGVDDGHIININSISGHRLTPRFGNMVYSSTKFAAKMLTEGLRLELAQQKSKIRVTNVSPGLTETEIFEAGGWGTIFDDQVGKPILKPEAIADAVLFALSSPPDVQMAEIIVRPTGEGA